MRHTYTYFSTLAKIGCEIAERRDFWVKKLRRLAILWNRKFSIFCRVTHRQLEDQLDFPVINLAFFSAFFGKKSRRSAISL